MAFLIYLSFYLWLTSTPLGHQGLLLMLTAFFHETEMEIIPQKQKECPIPPKKYKEIFFTDVLKRLFFPIFTKGNICINVKKKFNQTENYTLHKKKACELTNFGLVR